MPRAPFNFFQFSSGRLISAYPDNISGYFTPSGLYHSPGGYLFGIEDLNNTFANYTITPTGNLSSSNPDVNSVGFFLSGNFFPVISESGSISFSYTGQTIKDNIDSYSYTSNFTGDIKQMGLDAPNYFLLFTGGLIKTFLENSYVSNQISGNITPQLIVIPTYNLTFSGNIVKYDKDIISLSIGVESITWSKGSPIVVEEDSDASINIFGIEYIGWSQLN